MDAASQDADHGIRRGTAHCSRTTPRRSSITQLLLAGCCVQCNHSSSELSYIIVCACVESRRALPSTMACSVTPSLCESSLHPRYLSIGASSVVPRC